MLKFYRAEIVPKLNNRRAPYHRIVGTVMSERLLINGEMGSFK